MEWIEDPTTDAMLRTLLALSNLILSIVSRGRYYYAHFTDRHRKAQNLIFTQDHMVVKRTKSSCFKDNFQLLRFELALDSGYWEKI